MNLNVLYSWYNTDEPKHSPKSKVIIASTYNALYYNNTYYFLTAKHS